MKKFIIVLSITFLLLANFCFFESDIKKAEAFVPLVVGAFVLSEEAVAYIGTALVASGIVFHNRQAIYDMSQDFWLKANNSAKQNIIDLIAMGAGLDAVYDSLYGDVNTYRDSVATSLGSSGHFIVSGSGMYVYNEYSSSSIYKDVFGSYGSSNYYYQSISRFTKAELIWTANHISAAIINRYNDGSKDYCSLLSMQVYKDSSTNLYTVVVPSGSKQTGLTQVIATGLQPNGTCSAELAYNSSGSEIVNYYVNGEIKLTVPMDSYEENRQGRILVYSSLSGGTPLQYFCVDYIKSNTSLSIDDIEVFNPANNLDNLDIAGSIDSLVNLKPDNLSVLQSPLSGTVTENSISLIWSPMDNASYYDVVVDGFSTVEGLASTTATLTGLNAGTTYNVKVIGYDSSGNIVKTYSKTFTTSAAGTGTTTGTGSLTEVLSRLTSLAGSVSSLSNAIDYVSNNVETLTDVVTNTISSTTSIATSITDAISRFFDLSRPINMEPLKLSGLIFTTKFPFSLPWDLLRSFQSISGSGTNPPELKFNVEYPYIGQVTYNFDLSMWNNIAVAVRAVTSLLFGIGLIMITRRIMGGDV